MVEGGTSVMKAMIRIAPSASPKRTTSTTPPAACGPGAKPAAPMPVGPSVWAAPLAMMATRATLRTGLVDEIRNAVDHERATERALQDGRLQGRRGRHVGAAAATVSGEVTSGHR